MNASKRSISLNRLVLFFLIISSITIVLIFNSNFQMGFINQNILSLDLKIIIFSIYVIIFVISNLLLLKWAYEITKDTHQKKKYFILIFIVYSALSLILIFTLIQMVFLKSYNSVVFYLTTYISFISSFVLLSILSVKFYRWFLRGRNYFILLYGILFSLYSISLLLVLIYLINGLATHPSFIEPVSPRMLIANTYAINIVFQNNIAFLYDIIFSISFVLAWVLTVFMLKQYSLRIGKYKFWILVSLPLIFYLMRSEILYHYIDVSNLINLTNISAISSPLLNAILYAFLTSDIQISGIFFGLSFLPIILKIKNYQLQKDMIIIVIGMVIIFGSRDLHSIFISSFPPGGVVTISFMAVGSFVLFNGILSFIQLATKDKQFYRDLISRIETDSLLLKDILLSEKEMEVNKRTKVLMDYASEWQKKNEYKEMNLEEVKEIIGDIIFEIRKNKDTSSFGTTKK
jgi:hypothetical protein